MGKICRVYLSGWKHVLAIRTVCLETEAKCLPLEVAGTSSAKVSGEVVGQPFDEKVLEGMSLKILCHFKNL